MIFGGFKFYVSPYVHIQFILLVALLPPIVSNEFWPHHACLVLRALIVEVSW